MLIDHVMVFQLCRPIWNLWLRYALMTGVLDGSVEDYQVRWVAPPLEMLDARAEVAGLQAKVRNGFLSRTEAVNQTGLDAEQVEGEIAAENGRADALGLVLDSDPRRVRNRVWSSRAMPPIRRPHVHSKEKTMPLSTEFTREAALDLVERAAEHAPASFNAESYTVDCVFSTGAAVERAATSRGASSKCWRCRPAPPPT